MTERFLDDRLPLFAKRPLARASDGDPSQRGAGHVRRSGKLSRQKARVLAAVQKNPGCTSQELSRLMDERDRYLTSRRLPDLLEDGLVHKGAKRTCGATGQICWTWWSSRSEKTAPSRPDAGSPDVMSADDRERLRGELAGADGPAGRFLRGLTGKDRSL